MAPEDLACVERSWSVLRHRRRRLLQELAAHVGDAPTSPVDAPARAEWLLAAVEELVGLLATPSALAEHARAVGARWQDPCRAPSFAIEGRAWMAAASRTADDWTQETEAAWRQAWLLLSDVLAAESLSPFAAERPPGRRP